MSTPQSSPLQVAWTFGRASSCDVVLQDSAVSNRHGRLTQLADQFVIEDLGSTNGIFVRGERINQPTLIQPTDPVTLGQRFPFPWLDFPIPFEPEVRQRLQHRPETPAAQQTYSAPPNPDQEETVRGVKPGTEPSNSNKMPPKVQSRGKPAFVVGRDPECDVLIEEPTISWRHCQVEIRDQLIVIVDLGSANGIFRQGSQQRAISITIGVEEYAYLGAYRLHGHEIARWFGISPAELRSTEDSPLEDASESSPSSPQETVHLGKPGKRPVTVVSDGSEIDHSEPPKFITVPEHPVILGRDPSADHVMNYPMISWRHARIWRENESLWIEDLGSTNGTFVDGKRIKGRHEVRPGDSILLGSYRITLNQADAGVDLVAQDCRGALTLEARNVTVKVPGRTLLESLSITIEPGEFVGLMGPSGSGKTTLINALNGYRRPTDGVVVLDGFDLHDNYDLFRGQIGYVPQDDIMHPDLTVREALYYTARLRLPPDFSDVEIDRRIDDVLNQLGLSDAKETLIGSPDQRGISGGQRKRVNLAMELLTDPSILILDEPTSGLSSVDTMVVMNLLRELANRGKSVLLTIHQPSMDAYRKLDHLLLISKDAASSEPGRLAFFGPAYPDALDYFRQHSPTRFSSSRGPDEMLQVLAQKPSHVWVAMYGQTQYRSQWVTQRQGRVVADSTRASRRGNRGSGMRQAFTLSSRSFRLKLRDKANSILLIAQAPVIAFLIAIVFGKKAAQTESWTDMSGATATTLFLMGLSAIWCGCSNAIREIVGERAIYKRERMVNLKIHAYLQSKLMILMMLSLVQSALMLIIVYPSTGLDGPWWIYLALLWMTSCLGIGLGLAVSSATRSSEFAVATLPLLILPNVMLGGVLMPIQEMPAAGQWISHLVPARWTFEAMIATESDDKPRISPLEQTASIEYTPKQSQADNLAAPDPETAPPSATQSDSQRSRSSVQNSPGRSNDAGDRVPADDTSASTPTEVDIAERFFPEEERNPIGFTVFVLASMLVLSLLTVGGLLKKRDSDA